MPTADGRIPTPWSRNHWSCFLDDAAYISAAMRYVENNPRKERMRPQSWNFVTPCNGTVNLQDFDLLIE